MARRSIGRSYRSYAGLGLAGAMVFVPILFAAPACADSLECTPIYGQAHFRSQMPSYVERPYETYYLFRNADLFHYSIRYTHTKAEPADVALSWPDDLEIEGALDGIPIDPETIAFEPVARRVSEREYFFDDQWLDGATFEERAEGRVPEPLFENRSTRSVDREVESFALRFYPYDQAILDVALVGADGEPLAPGIYELKFRDRKAGLACDSTVVVLRQPETELDRTDEWIVRYQYHAKNGDAEAATAALRRATEVSPDCLKAWYYRLVDADRRADLETWELAATHLERILVSRGGHAMAVSPHIQRFAGGVLRRLDEVRAEIADRAAARDRGDTP